MALFVLVLSMHCVSPSMLINHLMSVYAAVLMRSRQKELDKVNMELDRRTLEMTDLQLRLQDAEKTLVCLSCVW